MNSKFKISIPKPCHENWNKMTPKEKGRFCSSCSKTVVDFTKKSTKEIQDYLVENKKQRVCGHFYKKQLDTIVIEIPQVTFQQQLSFQKLFILALFFVMGTTLFSCQYSDGKKQKIENVVIIDTLKKIDKKIDSLTIFNPKDSTSVWVSHCPKEEKTLKKDNLIDLTTVGDVEENYVTDGIIIVDREIELQETVGFIVIEETPRFKEAKNLSKEKAKKDFDERMKKFVQENFNVSLTENLGLSEGKYKIFTQFTIDKTGNVTDIKVRAPHLKLKKEIIKMLQKFPQFIPGKQAGKVVKTKYSLPISFEIE